MWCVAWCLLLAAGVWCKTPHVLFIVMDDLGWDDVGFRSHQINTPTIDSLAQSGIVLDQYYVQPSCSPTRSSIMSGRMPLHTGINNYIPLQASYGLPLNCTTMAQKMRERGYRTHATGKWHMGFHKWAYTPTFRGFESFRGFYAGGEDYFTHMAGGAYDLHHDVGENCGENCSLIDWQSQHHYSTHVFTKEAVKVITEHDPSEGLFLYLAYQAVHSPDEVPDSYIQPYVNTIADKKRRTFAGMLSCADEGIKNVTEALKAKGMIDDTLIIFTADNGGPTQKCATTGTNNWPLRGGKCAIWEGGTRGTGFITGAGIKASTTPFPHLMHAVDWLPTVVTAVGGQQNYTLPLDGVSQWSALRGGTPARTEVYYGITDSQVGIHGPAFRKGKWKLIVGNSGGNGDGAWTPRPNMSFPQWELEPTCPLHLLPNTCYPGDDLKVLSINDTDACCAACSTLKGCVGFTQNFEVGKCFLKKDVPASHSGRNCTSGMAAVGMLYDLSIDSTEHHDVSEGNPTIVDELLARVKTYEATGVPQAKSECGKPTHKIDPHVGPVWLPWC